MNNTILLHFSHYQVPVQNNNRRANFFTFDCPNYYNYAIIAKYAYFLCTILIYLFVFLFYFIDSIKSNANRFTIDGNGFTKNIFLFYEATPI